MQLCKLYLKSPGNYNKCTLLVWDVEGGDAYVQGKIGVWGSLFHTQFCYKPKNSQKK